MSTLHDRLADLAEEAPTAGTAPSARTGLWERGLRYRRVRRAGTLAVLGTAVLVLALLGGITWHRAAPPIQPASGQVGLPDRVWDPSPWLPTSSRPGRLVAVEVAEQGSWTGKSSGVAGISATTGEYAFLDLPDLAHDSGQAPVLSPDGRHVAYWISGETTGTPSSTYGPVTGVAVYDTETGRVRRHRIRTAHGLSPDFLAWADATTLVFSAGQVLGGDDASVDEQSTSRSGALESWPVDGRPSLVPRSGEGVFLESAGHGRVLIGTTSNRPGRAHLLIDLHEPAATRFVDAPTSEGSVNGLPLVVVDGSGKRYAFVQGNRNPNRVQAGRIGHVAQVPDTDGTWGVLDWLDARTIVTLKRIGSPFDQRSGLFSVSVGTGRWTQLVSFPRFSTGGGWQFATDLLGAPSVHAHEPPHPVDPRWVTGLAATTVLAAIAGLVLWRRRVRP